jgi:uncharacterized protein YcnI
MKRAYVLSYVLLVCSLLSPSLYAHVTVRPSQAGVASFQTFTIGVPVEKSFATIALRLEIPDTLQYVSPNVKPGWKIEIKKAGEGENAKVTELIWTGGTIPAGFRDEFLFSARVPAEEITLSWKAYQTYADGSVVSWDLAPDAEQPKKEDGSSDFSTSGPYSMTKVINDLGKAPGSGMLSSLNISAIVLSIVAIVAASLAIVLQLLRRKPATRK